MRFTSLLKKIIIESADHIDFLIDTYTKPKKKKDGTKKKPKMSKEQLFAIIQADPDTRTNEVDIATAKPEELKKVKVGPYVTWLIKNFINLNQTVEQEVPYGHPNYEKELKRAKELFFEDLYKVTDDLKKFKRFNKRIPLEKRDISKVSSPQELYSLVKDFDLTLATTTKAERKEAPVHPGGKLIFDSPELRVVEITDKGSLGKEAACFYGGNQIETRWCTSAPGLSHFDYYIGKGPLYVVFNPSDPKVSPKTGLPVERYQLNFETDSYMDKDDLRINIVDKLNGPWQAIKPLFKSKFAKGLTESGGTSLRINGFSSGNVGKFVALYGLEELINAQPDTLEELQIRNNEKNGLIITIPDSIKRFKNLQLILFDNCIDRLPEAICDLENLNFLSLMNNPQLKTVPECIADMPNLMFLNTKGSDNIEIPEKIRQKAKSKLGNYMLDFQP